MEAEDKLLGMVSASERRSDLSPESIRTSDDSRLLVDELQPSPNFGYRDYRNQPGAQRVQGLP